MLGFQHFYHISLSWQLWRLALRLFIYRWKHLTFRKVHLSPPSTAPVLDLVALMVDKSHQSLDEWDSLKFFPLSQNISLSWCFSFLHDHFCFSLRALCLCLPCKSGCRTLYFTMLPETDVHIWTLMLLSVLSPGLSLLTILFTLTPPSTPPLQLLSVHRCVVVMPFMREY